MVYKNTLEAIIENVEEIKILVAGFINTNKIPSIEMDLTLQKVRNLYDILLILKKIHSVETDRQSAKMQGGKGKTAGKVKPGINNIAPAATADIDTGDDLTSTEEETAALDLSEEKSAEKDDDIKIISDRFRSHTASIHDSLSKSQQYDELSEKLKSKPISDIGNAIGINDKFIFIKDLFNGDTNMYNNTIKILNSATNFNDAYNYLIGNFSWDMDSPLVQILLDLIRRKLIINKNE